MSMLTENEKTRLISSIKATLAIPFIDDIEDYILEAIFCYVKNIPSVDPLTNIRSKKLFDVVDEKTKTGWSIKGLQWNISQDVDYELVIQRADIFKKAKQLGFDSLSINSPPALLGEALIKHWQQKINEDVISQKIENKKVFILLKSRSRDKFAYVEENLASYNHEDLEWNWTSADKVGLQGKLKTNGRCIYKWYSGQKQFFERFKLDKNAFIFDIVPKRLSPDLVVKSLSEHIK